MANKDNRTLLIDIVFKGANEYTPSYTARVALLNNWGNQNNLVEEIDKIITKLNDEEDTEEAAEFLEDIDVYNEGSNYNATPMLVAYKCKGAISEDGFLYEDINDFENTILYLKVAFNKIVAKLNDAFKEFKVELCKNIKISYDTSKSNYYYDNFSELSTSVLNLNESNKHKVLKDVN